MAKDRGLLESIKPHLDNLRKAGFHMSEALYRQVLENADEA
jgi:predicted nucleic acid-binding protein